MMMMMNNERERQRERDGKRYERRESVDRFHHRHEFIVSE